VNTEKAQRHTGTKEYRIQGKQAIGKEAIGIQLGWFFCCMSIL